MSDLSSAMQRVDTFRGPHASSCTTAIPTWPGIVARDSTDDNDIAAEAKRRAETAACLRALARTVVALSMEAGGQDPRHWRAADALTAENIERLLLGCYEAKTVELPAAFRQGSPPVEIERARNVATALGGEG